MAARALTRPYNGVAQAFHWTVVLLVVLQYATKWLSPAELSFATKQGLNAWHFGIGPAILLLMFARLAWRLTHTPPRRTTFLSRSSSSRVPPTGRSMHC